MGKNTRITKGTKFYLKMRKTEFNQDAYLGPYRIIDVRHNGTARARKGKITDTFNICNMTPYKE